MKLKLTVLTVAVAALGFSAAVFAAPPTGKGKPATTPASTNAAKPTVMVVVHGTIVTYNAANGSTNGSVQITVKSANHFAKDLKNQTQPITFVVSSSTKIVGTPTATHNATLKWRATKAPTTSAPAGAVFQLIDQGSAA
jgi:hypothetical protein